VFPVVKTIQMHYNPVMVYRKIDLICLGKHLLVLVRGNVHAELRIYICHDFFEVGNACACIIEDPLLFYIVFLFSTFF